MPRLGVALIGMALAVPLLKFAVTLTNDLGGLVQSLFFQIAGPAATGTSTDAGTTAGAVLGTITAASITVVVLGGLGILSLLGTVVVALLIGIFVLAVRQLVIFMLILLAPLAIAAYVIPGGQKLWEFWKKTLTTTLIMYPLIMGFISAGAAISYIMPQNSNSMQILAIIVYFAPYLMLPMTFKMAGGLMGTVFSMANDRNRGVFDRLKKFRGQKMAENAQLMKTGNRYRGNSWAARQFNRATRGAAIIGSGEAGINVAKWGQRTRSAISAHTLGEAQEAAEKNADFARIKANDDFLTAALEHPGSTERQKQFLKGKGYDDRSAEDAVASIRAARRSMSNEAFETAAAMALPATGTAFKGGAGEMHEMINRVTGGDRNRAATMLNAMRQGAAQSRRFDLGGGSYGQQLMIMNNQYDGTVSSASASRDVVEQSLEGQGGGYIAGARNGAVKNFAPVMFDKLEAAAGSGDIQSFKRELAVVAGRYDAMSQVAPENARVLADELLSKKLGDSTVQQLIEQNRNDPDFLSMRREIGANSARAGQQLLAAAANSVPNPATTTPIPPTP